MTLENMTSLPSERLLRLRQVLEIVPVSPSTLWLWVKQGKFPKPIKLGDKTTVWRFTDIEALIKPKEEGA